MRNNDPLYQLIKTLSGTEKRYFKLNANKQDGKKDYLDLFDFIDKQKEYDETKLKEFFKNKDFIKHIAVVKNYLFNTIIDSLHEFSKYDTAQYKIEELLKKIDVLYQKGLIDLCIKYIEKAKKIAEDHECFPELIKLIEIQYQISIKNSSRLFGERKTIQSELKLSIEKYYNFCLYTQLHSDVNDLLYRQNLPIESPEVQNILQLPFLIKQEMALSARASELYFIIHSRICEYTGNMEMAGTYMLNLLKTYENKPGLLQEYPLKYARAINGYLQSTFDAKKFEHFDHYLNVLEQLLELKISSENKNLIKGIYYVNLFIKNIEFGLFKEVIDLIEKIEMDVVQNNLVPTKIRIIIIYHECLAYIGNRQYKEAIKLINTVLTTNENMIPIIKRASKLLGIVCHYELGHIDLIENEILSIERHIGLLNNTEGEKLFLKYMKKIIKAVEKKEIVEHFNLFIKDLIALSNSATSFSVLRYFDIISWAESKSKNTPFVSLVKEKAKKHHANSN